MSQDPVDEPDGQEIEEAPAAAETAEPEVSPAGGSVDEALEQPPDAGVLEAYERRARLAEDRLAEVLAAYRQFKADNDGMRERVTRNLERQFDECDDSSSDRDSASFGDPL